MSDVPSSLSGFYRPRIAVLDGPVDTGHPCFQGALLNFPLGPAAFDKGSAAVRHGTHVASILFGQPGSMVAGLAPAAHGLIVPVFHGEGPEGLRCSQLDLARAISIALDHGAEIINVSGGQFVGECAAEADLAAALAACEEQRVLVIAAAGNDGCDCSHVPACVPTVLAVGAMGRDGRPLAAGNWGPAYAVHGVIAPGEAIIGAEPGGGIAARTGTSFATAITSGTAANMLAERRASGSAADPLAVRAALAYAAEGYARIFTAFVHQVLGREVVHEKKKKKEKETVTLFAVPGFIAGSIRLMSGETVPVLVPAGRGFVAWDVEDAVSRFIDELSKKKIEGETEDVREERFESMRGELARFLPDYRNLFTRKHQNLGLMGRDRALNFAATSAFRAFDVLEKIVGLKLILDDVEMLKSPSCRTGSECYDIRLKLFRESDITAAIHVFQFTIDVSATIPVGIGDTSSWRERP